jgi:hypothetical protein
MRTGIEKKQDNCVLDLFGERKERKKQATTCDNLTTINHHAVEKEKCC